MKTFSLLFAALLAVSIVSTPADAQNYWKYFSRPDLGIGLNAYTNTIKGSDENGAFNYNNNIGQWAIMANFNLPVADISDHASAGIMPGVSLGLSPNNTGESLRYTTQSVNLTIPVFATIKFNNDATWKGNDGMAVGFAGGFGYSYHMFSYIGENGGNGHSFGDPSFMVELNFGERHSTTGILKLRYIGSLGPGYSGTTNGVTETLNNPFCIYLAWTPGY